IPARPDLSQDRPQVDVVPDLVGFLRDAVLAVDLDHRGFVPGEFPRSLGHRSLPGTRKAARILARPPVVWSAAPNRGYGDDRVGSIGPWAVKTPIPSADVRGMRLNLGTILTGILVLGILLGFALFSALLGQTAAGPTQPSPAAEANVAQLLRAGCSEDQA